MQIVIEVPNVTFERLAKIANDGKEPLGFWERTALNGSPLPKGHGRLIDADKCIDELAKAIPYFIDNSESLAYVEGLSRARIEIECAPTVIEADKEKQK